jgi:DNA-binding XRE family transcriptional regulator
MKTIRTFNDRLKEDLKNPKFNKLFQEEFQKLSIGLKLAEVREKVGLTQKELARRAHTSQQAVSRLESGSYTGYTISILEKIALTMGCTLDIRFKKV